MILRKKDRPAGRPLCIGITLGDPAGVGPEVALRSFCESFSQRNFVPVLIGRLAVIKAHYPAFFSMLTVMDKAAWDKPDLSKIYIDGSVDTARESLACIDRSIELWAEGFIDAVVTGPVNKGLIEKSGTSFMGHTEYYAEKTGGTPYMMMFSAQYRVLLVTTHIAVGTLMTHLNGEAFYRTIEAGHKALLHIDGSAPRIAVCGLDPHCGDHGAIGDFDDSVTAGAVQKARAAGINAEGPISADTLFMPDKWKKFQLAIACYHDQGLIPFKMLAFETGVNVTLGLDIIPALAAH